VLHQTIDHFAQTKNIKKRFKEEQWRRGVQEVDWEIFQRMLPGS
jgi:hypothetical protein